MKKALTVVIALALASAFARAGAQGKPALVVHVFTTAPDVTLPYDMKQFQPQMVAELKVQLGKEFDIVTESPTTASGNVYALDCEVTAWHAGNAAKRLIVGLGSGR